LRDASSVIRPKLQPGEEILWCARPHPWPATRPPLLIIAFAVLCAALIIVMPRVNGNLEPRDFIGLCFCFYAIVSRTAGLFNSWFTVYALTNRRLIIEAPLARLQSLTGDGISSISRSGSDARGTLKIGYKTSLQLAFEQAMKTKQRPRCYGLYGIQTAGEVEALIRKTLLSRTPLAKGDSA